MHCFISGHGHVKLTVTSKSGKKAVIAILREGDFFGEGCVTKQSLRISTASAIETTTIVRVMRADIVRIIHREPEFAKLFISHLLIRIAQIEEEFVDQIFNSSEKRLARVLLLMAGIRAERRDRARPSQSEPGNACGNGRHNEVQGEPLHE